MLPDNSNESALIEFSDFEKVKICAGTIIDAKLNEKALKPAYILTIDFGRYGIKTSSAQLTQNYSPSDLINRQIVAVLNFPAKRVAGIKSEVLVLGAVADDLGVILLEPTQRVPNGTLIG